MRSRSAYRNPGRIKNELAKVRNDLAVLTKEFMTIEGIATMAKHLEAKRKTVRPKVEDTHLGLGERGFADRRPPSLDRCQLVGRLARPRSGPGATPGYPVDVLHCIRATRPAPRVLGPRGAVLAPIQHPLHRHGRPLGPAGGP